MRASAISQRREPRAARSVDCFDDVLRSWFDVWHIHGFRYKHAMQQTLGFGLGVVLVVMWVRSFVCPVPQVQGVLIAVWIAASDWNALPGPFVSESICICGRCVAHCR
jgi:hypothetical protein